jgi:hypothetical protein
VLLRGLSPPGQNPALTLVGTSVSVAGFVTKNILKNKYTKVCVYQKEGLFLYSQMRGQLNKNR